MTDLYSPIERCILCGSSAFSPVLDLGEVPLPTFPRPGDDVLFAPLALQRCRVCDLVQLTHAVEKGALYSHYYYRSGLNESMVAALQRVVKDAMGMVDLSPGDVVLDIGANDGTLLAQYPENLVKVGFDPSDIGAEPFGLDVVREYFPPAGAWHHYLPARAKIITACAMFYDLLDPVGFLLAAREWLDDKGILVVQMPDLRTMLARTMVDNVCHEHVAYYPNHTFIRAARDCGFFCSHIDHNDVNGGSLRYTFRKTESGPRKPTFEGELRLYFADYETGLERFGDRAREYLALVRRWVQGQRPKTWAYGASTKGITLLAAARLGPEDIAAVADRNPEKWGREMPTPWGGIPIVPEREWRKANPPMTLVLPWGFLPAFREREKRYLERGGRFVVPLPIPKVLTGERGERRADPATAPAASAAGHRVPT